MISCDFVGRLGNNLFQIATVISEAKRLNTDFVFPYTTTAGHRGERIVDLSMFNYNFNRVSKELITFPLVAEKQFHYVELNIKDNTKLHGYFQSNKYFDNVKNELLKNYFQPSNNVVYNLSKYNISTNSLGISVRRGDYLMLQDNHCVLSIEYYQNAINEYFLDNTEEIYIFSDDIDWCRSIFGDEVHYVEDTVGTQLFLMSKMKHLILSNSTFAWWGAYLNQNNGYVIVPNPWFGPNYGDKNTKDLHLPNWISVFHERKIILN
jgi:hypothetical protein